MIRNINQAAEENKEESFINGKMPKKGRVDWVLIVHRWEYLGRQWCAWVSVCVCVCVQSLFVHFVF